MRRHAWLLALWLIGALFGGRCMAAEVQTGFCIATDGRDQNPGTQDKPFATLERARDAVREARKPGLPKGGVTVWLRGAFTSAPAGRGSIS